VIRALVATAMAAALAACATAPPASTARTALADGTTPAQMVAIIRGTAVAAADELDVQPIRDPEVEDLRQQAIAKERAGDMEAAAAALDAALAIVPDDPAVLQERAEAALLLWDFDGAQSRAERALALGGKVGPLCRRHWATVEQVGNARLADALAAATAPRAKADALAAAQAAATQARALVARALRERDACTVGAAPRY
jgi:tetratricopeptide (TPR) repeat protein